MFWKARTNLIYEKVSPITRNMGRCTELTQEWLGWQDKLATSMYLQNPYWHLSSGSASMVWPQRSEKCCSFFIIAISSVVPLWRSTRLQLTCWGLWNHILHIKLPWQTTHWLLALLLNLESSAWKIWFMRSILLNNAFKKPTTSAGPSNDLFHEVEWRWWRSCIL